MIFYKHFFLFLWLFFSTVVCSDVDASESAQGLKNDSEAAIAKQLPSLKVLVAVYEFPIPTHTFVTRHISDLIARGHEVSVYSRKRSSYKCSLTELSVFYEDLPKNLDYFDIIICQFGISGVRFATLKKEKKFTGKLVTFFRGCDISSYLHRYPNCYQELFEYGDLFLPVCDYFKEILISRGCPADKIIVSYSPIDVELFSKKCRVMPSDGAIRLLSVGRLVEKKGFEYALYAVKKAVKQYPNLEYVIVGSGPQESILKRLVRDLNLEKHVKILGRREHAEIISLLHNTHLFLAPSLTAQNYDQEGIPDALKEAMATGAVVISTQHSGIPELVVDRQTGFLVPEKDSEALAKKIIYACQHSASWEFLGNSAHACIEQGHKASKEYARLEAELYRLINF